MNTENTGTDTKLIEFMLRAQSSKTWAIVAIVVSIFAIIISGAALFFTSTQLTVNRIAQINQTAPVEQAGFAMPSPVAPPVSVVEAPQIATNQTQVYTPDPRVPAVAAGQDGTMYSYDGTTQQFFSINKAGEVFVIPRQNVPQDVIDQLTNPRTAGGMSSVPSLERVTQTARNAIAAGTDRDNLAINQLLAQPDVASGILSGVDGLAGITLSGRSSGEKPVYVFFDPRCPYCHKLYEALGDQVGVRWLPVLVLPPSPGADGAMATLLGEVEVGRDAEGRITSSTLRADTGRASRLEAQLSGQVLGHTASVLTQDQQDIVLQNETVMRQLYGPQSLLLGVPTIVVPRADGTAKMFSGYSPETVAEIVSLVTQGAAE